eukprot:11172764-Lingulodinium_polyedra.AAC.1
MASSRIASFALGDVRPGAPFSVLPSAWRPPLPPPGSKPSGPGASAASGRGLCAFIVSNRL